ncbi:hematopoietic death receptor [Scomber scombrus]|uniref:Hematopoietic death receptor n=1 Tax=Scomber scombrus TaxID=13677 RepID=A0AAV1NMX6_SCOSC
MRSFSRLTVFLALIFIFKSTWASPQSDHDSSGSRSRRGAPCGTNVSSLNNICCLNCPAGTHMKSPCTKHGEMGECGECDYGTFTEHSNDLKQCFKCAQCRPDQIIVRQCIQTQNTECECKAGRFCAHDQACEVCKKCSRCEKDEVIVRNCTSTTNTECKKIQSPPPSGNTWLWPSLSASLIVVAIVVVVAVLYKKHKASDSQSSRPDGLKPGERNTEEGRNGQTRMPSFLVRARSSDTVEDECEALCESSCSSASNSQHNIAIQANSALLASPPQASPMIFLRQPDMRMGLCRNVSNILRKWTSVTTIDSSVTSALATTLSKAKSTFHTQTGSMNC